MSFVSFNLDRQAIVHERFGFFIASGAHPFTAKTNLTFVHIPNSVNVAILAFRKPE
jgi:hypothetical protein